MAHHLSHSPSRKRHARAHSSPTTLLTTLLVLSFLTTRTTAVPLSAFMPSLDPATLTPSCAAIYTSPIPTCTAADFSANSQCSSPCITSLVTLSTSIYNACGGDTRNDQLLVGQFLAGNGIPILCKGVVVVTMSGAESMTSVLPSATAASSTTILVSPSPSSLSIREPTSISTPTPTPSETSSQSPSQKSHATPHTSHNTSPTHTTSHAKTHTSSQHPTLTRSNLPTNAAQAAQAQYNHCIEYEANPFKDCRRPEASSDGQGQGNGGVQRRAASGTLLLGSGALGVGAAYLVGLV